MTRRTLLATPVLAFPFAASAARLPIKKAVEYSMLPTSLPIPDRFQLARDCGFEEQQLRQVHALAQLVRNLQRLLQAGLGAIAIACQQQRLRRVPEHLAGPRTHAEADVLFVGLPDESIALHRPARARVGPAAEPLACRSALTEREFVDERTHLVGKRRDATRVAKAHLEKRFMPGRDETCHGLAQLARALMRSPHVHASLFDQPATKELDRQQPEQSDLRVRREDLVGRNVQRLRDREPALEP